MPAFVYVGGTPSIGVLRSRTSCLNFAGRSEKSSDGIVNLGVPSPRCDSAAGVVRSAGPICGADGVAVRQETTTLVIRMSAAKRDGVIAVSLSFVESQGWPSGPQ